MTILQLQKTGKIKAIFIFGTFWILFLDIKIPRSFEV